MAERIAGALSVRRRLLLFLIPPLSLLVVCAGALTYVVALSVATTNYDRSLLDPALDLAENIRVGADGPHLDMLMQAQQALLFDHVDTLVFQIRAIDSTVIAGTPALAAPPTLAVGEPRFYDGTYDGEPVRIAAVLSRNGFYVLVGETLHKRRRLIYEVLAAELVPTLLIALLVIAVAWAGVTHGIAPLARIRDELQSRGADDLHPLDETSAPPEISPAIKAFNNLLDRIRAASAVQQRFLASAAHQLRTPLAGVRMHLELVLRRDLPGDIRGEIESAHVATLRVTQLAAQLLVLARAEAAGADGGDAESFDLRDVARTAVQQWVPRAIARNIDLGFALDPAPLSGNPLLMAELLNNLIDNAIRYTQGGGTVTVRTGHDVDTVFVSVEDNGSGIPEEARDKVFERFYRVPGTPGEGSGLGLAIVHEVAERHRGRVEVEPGASGGVRLTATFPAAPARP
jgi:two-component system sensor histidine kinase TctE